MTTLLSRRHCLALGGAAALVSAGGVHLAKAQTSPVVLRYGLQRGAFGNIKVSLAESSSKYDLKYDQKIFNDATAVILALEQRELELGNVSAQHVVRAIDQGMNLVVICGFGGGSNVLVTNLDVKLKTDDLEGFKALVAARKSKNKFKIGTPTGSMQHLKLVYFLQSLNIDPDQDVDIVNVAFQDHVRALDGRQIDMAMALAGFASMAIVNGVGNLFHHVYKGENGTWELGAAIRRDLIDEKPELVQRVVDSHVTALKSFMDDKDKSVQLEAKESGFPPKAIEMEIQKFRTFSYKIVMDDITRTAKQMHKVGWVNRDLSPEVEKYVDLRFLTKATGQSRDQLTTPL